MMKKKKNTVFEVLTDLIKNEMDIDDFKGVAKILQEDFEAGLINAIEYAALISFLNEQMRFKLVRY